MERKITESFWIKGKAICFVLGGMIVFITAVLISTGSFLMPVAFVLVFGSILTWGLLKSLQDFKARPLWLLTDGGLQHGPKTIAWAQIVSMKWAPCNGLIIHWKGAANREFRSVLQVPVNQVTELIALWQQKCPPGEHGPGQRPMRLLKHLADQMRVRND